MYEKPNNEMHMLNIASFGGPLQHSSKHSSVAQAQIIPQDLNPKFLNQVQSLTQISLSSQPALTKEITVKNSQTL